MTESTLNKEIGQRIKKLRKQQKMTLKEIGAHVGISESTAKRYEDGSIKKISIDIVKKFAVALECPPAYLMGWEDARRPEPSAAEDDDLPPLNARDEREIAKRLEELLVGRDERNGYAAMGGTVDDEEEDRELLKSSLLTALRLAKRMTKQKFTPKKYRK